MKYTIDKSVFELNPNIMFGILIGNDMKNSATSQDDEERLRKAESKMREEIKPEDIRNLHNVSLYTGHVPAVVEI